MNVAILTNFNEFNPGYSLTGIVHDQAVMLSLYGHKVHVFTSEKYNDSYDSPWPLNVEVHHTIPSGNLIDYESMINLSEEHKELAKKVLASLMAQFHKYEIDISFDHDWIFTGWNVPYAIGVKAAGREMPEISWFHWVHSIPSAGRDWWNIKTYGSRHKIVFPNETDRLLVAEQFRGEISDVRTVPHIKDLRTWYEFCPESYSFVDKYPEVMQADFVQVYPASTDHLFAKRLDMVIGIFGKLKERGFSVCLVVANQWTNQREGDLEEYRNIAKVFNLEDDEFIFTSDFGNEFKSGISRRMLRELLLCSNLFIYPTRQESFGLVGPEAALSGAFLVLNKSLQMSYEIFGPTGLYLDFSSFNRHITYDDLNKFYYDAATIIIGRCYQSEQFRNRTWCRQHYNWDRLYKQVYEPMIEESIS